VPFSKSSTTGFLSIALRLLDVAILVRATLLLNACLHACSLFGHSVVYQIAYHRYLILHPSSFILTPLFFFIHTVLCLVSLLLCSSDKPLALAMWSLLLDGWKWLDEWNGFVEGHECKAINRDVWRQTLEFRTDVTELTAMEDDGWPILMDEFVEHMNEKNASSSSS
jgi:Cullin binding